MAATFRFRAAFYLAILGALLSVGAGFLLAQGGRASISGTISDASGSAVPGSTVTVVNTGTGLTTTINTSDLGSYVIPLLPVGSYSLTVKKEGFKTETQTGITITADQVATVNMILRVGAVTEQLTVSADAELINSQTAALTQVVSERAIQELPLNGRNPADLVLLAPGTVNVLQTSVGVMQTYTSHPSETGASANGGRQGSTYYLLDGSNNMDPYLGLAAPFPNADATQEFRVISNNFDAQYGFAPGAVVSIVTKSGTNEWHGAAFEFLRNDALNASDFFSHQKDSLKRNQFGGSLGGPIRKNRLFIFGNYQGTRASTTSNGSAVHTPTAAMLTGDFSSLLQAGIQIHDPNGVPYPNNRVPATALSKPALQLMQFIPTGDAPDGLLYVAGLHHTNDDDQYAIRADYNISSKHRLNGHAFIDRYGQPLQTGNGNLLLSDRSWDTNYYNYQGSYVWTISPNLLNNLVGSYGRMYSTSLAGHFDKDGNTICYSRFIPTVADPPGSGCSIEGLFLNGFGIAQTPSWYHRYIFNVTDAVTFNKGKHLIVAGVDIQRMSMADPSGWLSQPIISFNGNVTGYDFSDFLIGQAYSYQQGAGSNSTVTGNQLGAYVQDQIKLTPTFTLSAGVRWEPFLPPVPYNGRFTEFRAGQQSTRFPNAPVGLVFPGDAGVGDSGMPTRLNYFNPRLGIAWAPRFLPHTSIRSAFGVFTAPIDYSHFTHGADESPFSPTYSFNRIEVGSIDLSNPWANFTTTGGKSPFPPFVSQGPGLPPYQPPNDVLIPLPDFLGYSTEANFNLARTLSWNLSIEHQLKSNWLLRAAYVGSESYHLDVVMEKNPGIFAAGGARTLYPNFTNITQNESLGTASYNSGQFTVEKRFSQGLQFLVNYTFSKILDTASIGSIAFSGPLPDPFDPRFSRGISDLNFRHVFSANWVYQTPALRGSNALVRGALGSWQISGIWHAQSGIPFGIQGGKGNNTSLSQVGGDRADLVPGQAFNVQQGSKSQWLVHYFNPSAFVPNAPGTFGNSARNLLTGPKTISVDLGIDKNFPIRERYRLQFRWEMFNALNHPSFSNPDNNPTDAPFGQIFSTGYVPARVMQVALKLHF